MPTANYRLLSIGDPLKIGVADSRHLTVGAIGKQNVANAPYCIPNELICGEQLINDNRAEFKAINQWSLPL
jgi:hypothetical protein